MLWYFWPVTRGRGRPQLAAATSVQGPCGGGGGGRGGGKGRVRVHVHVSVQGKQSHALSMLCRVGNVTSGQEPHHSKTGSTGSR
jgi:hypothetical protein